MIQTNTQHVAFLLNCGVIVLSMKYVMVAHVDITVCDRKGESTMPDTAARYKTKS